MERTRRIPGSHCPFASSRGGVSSDPRFQILSVAAKGSSGPAGSRPKANAPSLPGTANKRSGSGPAEATPWLAPAPGPGLLPSRGLGGSVGFTLSTWEVVRVRQALPCRLLRPWRGWRGGGWEGGRGEGWRPLSSKSGGSGGFASHQLVADPGVQPELGAGVWDSKSFSHRNKAPVFVGCAPALRRPDSALQRRGPRSLHRLRCARRGAPVGPLDSSGQLCQEAGGRGNWRRRGQGCACAEERVGDFSKSGTWLSPAGSAPCNLGRVPEPPVWASPFSPRRAWGASAWFSVLGSFIQFY